MLSFANRGKEGVKVGQTAPAFRIEEDGTSGKSFDLKAEKGKFVVLSFWAGYDALSRVSDIRMQAAIDRLENQENVRLVSVSYDTNENVYRESVRLDGLDESTHYYDSDGEKSAIFRDFRLRQGFGNYLINPDGEIIARNFDPENLAQLICQ